MHQRFSSQTFLICLFFHCFTLLVDAAPRRFVFELANSEKFCFFEQLHKNTSYHFQFRVLRGGANDVGARVEDRQGITIKMWERANHETLEFAPEADGEHQFCFDNEFSTLSHKIISFELREKVYETLNELAGKTDSGAPSVETLLEISTDSIHQNLAASEDIQADLRSKERSDRFLLFDLHVRVTFWSVITCIIIVVTGLCQVWLLRSLFPDARKYTRMA